MSIYIYKMYELHSNEILEDANVWWKEIKQHLPLEVRVRYTGIE